MRAPISGTATLAFEVRACLKIVAADVRRRTRERFCRQISASSRRRLQRSGILRHALRTVTPCMPFLGGITPPRTESRAPPRFGRISDVSKYSRNPNPTGLHPTVKPSGATDCAIRGLNLKKAFGLATKRHKRRKGIEQKPLCPAKNPCPQRVLSLAE